MFWKIYFWVLSTVVILGFIVGFIDGLTPFGYIDLAFCVIGLIPVFGYSYKKRIFNISFWKLFAPLFVVWEAFFLMSDKQLSIENTEPSYVTLLIGIVFTIPGYVAVFLYAYRSLELLNEKEKV